MIIEREFKIKDEGHVVLYLDGPHKSDRDDEFFCIVGLLGCEIDEKEVIFGIDQFQAVILAMRHANSFTVRIARKIYPRLIQWELGSKPDDFGLGFDQ